MCDINTQKKRVRLVLDSALCRIYCCNYFKSISNQGAKNKTYQIRQR
ncbi:hypothetical protein HFN_0814 [Helicobacter fennelliae MRY12-0050]|uniref:Uncharacterized protein n=1 Tax=Helicobacter fennelliae MRY12-0050 TaxID=1325130 RepID=T1CS17_9HELI|nr:hypothetical protein HFN_0814 [Helicobacter fennelliae MRY12-0050]